jgi:hypothetical protein
VDLGWLLLSHRCAAWHLKPKQARSATTLSHLLTFSPSQLLSFTVADLIKAAFTVDYQRLEKEHLNKVLKIFKETMDALNLSTHKRIPITELFRQIDTLLAEVDGIMFGLELTNV